MMVHLYPKEWVAIVVVLGLGFLFQIKDALIPVTTWTYVIDYTLGTYSVDMKRHWLGGFGYNYSTQIYGAFGVLFAFLLDLAIKPMFQEDEQEGLQADLIF